jgi:hypothetical protein
MRHLTFLLVTVALTTAVFGQESKFDIGLEGGPSLTFLRGNDVIDTLHKPTIGFSGGLFFQYNFPKTFSLRTNIAFERKGSVAHVPEYYIVYNGNIITMSKYTIDTKFEYLTIPILIKATIGKKIKYFADVGLYFGYLIKQTFVITESTFQIVDYTSHDKRFDMGIIAGLGLGIPIKNKLIISYEIRNNLGLYNVSKVPLINNGKTKTNSTNLLIGLIYKFGTRQTETK